MKVVSVSRRTGGSGPEVELRLHAHLTVIRGLDDDSRSWLVDTLGHLDPSRAATATGELASSGVLLPFDAGSLELLGIDVARDGVLDAARLLPSHDGAGSPGDGDPASAGALEPQPLPSEPVADTGEDPGEKGPTTAPEVSDTAVRRRMAALRGRRQELQLLVDEIPVADLSAVIAALAALDDAPTTVVEEEAAELADAWHDLEKEGKALELVTSAEERAAIDAVRLAGEAVAAAEAELSRPHLDDDMVARIEAAHAAYLEASDKVDRRFGGGRARRQLAEAEVEEERLLTGLGFDSWVDYLVSASKRTDDPEMAAEHAALAAAREELEVCRAELDAIPGAVGRRRRRVRVLERERELVPRVAAVLGREPSGDAVEDELRALTVPYEPVAEVEALGAALLASGVDGATSDLPTAELAKKARQAVAVNGRAQRRRADLAAAIDALGDALSVLEAAAADGLSDLPEMAPLPDMAEPPVAFVDVIDPTTATEPAELAEPTEPTEPTEPAEPAEPADPTGPRESADAVATTTEPSEVDQPAADRRGSVDEMHWEAMVAIAGACTDGPGGQLPVVLDDPFAGLDPRESVELLTRLARHTDHVQMIVITDLVEVADWAEGVGPEHASVVEVAR